VRRTNSRISESIRDGRPRGGLPAPVGAETPAVLTVLGFRLDDDDRVQERRYSQYSTPIGSVDVPSLTGTCTVALLTVRAEMRFSASSRTSRANRDRRVSRCCFGPPAEPKKPEGDTMGIRVNAGQSGGEIPEGERKTVTALFADIKGSMELMEDLDPEEARSIIDPALKLMVHAVRRYDGYVVQSTGDAGPLR